MKWLKNEIKTALRELIKEESFVIERKSTEHIVLDPDRVNVLTIDCGQMPNGKAMEHLKNLNERLRYPGYKIVLIAKRS